MYIILCLFRFIVLYSLKHYNLVDYILWWIINCKFCVKECDSKCLCRNDHTQRFEDFRAIKLDSPTPTSSKMHLKAYQFKGFKRHKSLISFFFFLLIFFLSSFLYFFLSYLNLVCYKTVNFSKFLFWSFTVVNIHKYTTV